MAKIRHKRRPGYYYTALCRVGYVFGLWKDRRRLSGRWNHVTCKLCIRAAVTSDVREGENK